MTTLEIRRATESEIPEIWQLTHDAYVQKGYILPRPDGEFRHYRAWEDVSVRLVAIIDGRLVGTLTYTLDGEFGLPTDVSYEPETDILRAVGLPLGCCWRIVVAPDCRHQHRVAHGLMIAAARECVAAGEPVCLCEVNPRHVDYYRKRLGFREVARRDSTRGLIDAPSVLMCGGPGTYSRLLKG
jgi:predicted N-acetyltransferase YhbS